MTAIPATPQVFATGGALCSSPLWQSILANSIGVPLFVSHDLCEASSLGAAWLGAVGSGVHVSLSAPEGHKVLPTEEGMLAMELALARQEALYRSVYGDKDEAQRTAVLL